MHSIQKFRRKRKTRRNIRKTKTGNKGTKGNIKRSIIDNKRNTRTIKGIIMKHKTNYGFTDKSKKNNKGNR